MTVFRSSSCDFIPSSHDDPRDPGAVKKIMFSREDLPEGRVQMVNFAKLLKGKSFERHYHEKMAEVFVIISGKILFRVGEEEVLLTDGDGLIVEGRVEHEAENVGDDDVLYMCFGIVHGEGGKTVVV